MKQLNLFLAGRRTKFLPLLTLLTMFATTMWGTAPQIDLRGKTSALVLPKANSNSSYTSGDWRVMAPSNTTTASSQGTITQSAVTYGTIDFIYTGDAMSDYCLQFTKNTGYITTTILSDYGVDITIKWRQGSGGTITASLTGTDNISNTKTGKGMGDWGTREIGTTTTSATFTISASSAACGVQYIVITPKAGSSCGAPTAPSNSSISSTGFTANWTKPGTAPTNGYVVAYKATSATTTPADGITESAHTGYDVVAVASGTTESASITSNLTAGETYDWWVRSRCTTGSSYSAWTSKTTVTIPKITAGTPSGTSSYVAGSGSAGSSQTFTVSGAGLTGNLTVTAPTNFQVSLDNSSWGDSKTITASGTLSSTTVYFRLASGLSQGSYGPSNVTISGGGAASVIVSVSGSVGAACSAAPTVSAATSSAQTTSSITVNCAGISSLGTGTCTIDHYGFVYGTSSNPKHTSDDSGTGTVVEKGTTYTTTNTAFGSTTISGLTAGQTYYIRPYAHNSCGWAYGDQVTVTTLDLSSITITTGPTKIAYLVGETFASAGAVVTATYTDASTAAVSASWTPTTALSAGSQTITATYTENGTTKTATTTVNVYSVTVNKVNMSETAIDDAGVSASCSVRTLSQSVGSTKYKFNSWEVTAGGVTVSDNSITGTPNANIVINAKFHEPIAVAWTSNGATHSAGGPTTEVQYGTQWKDLTLPSDPSAPSSCSSKTFMGWTNMSDTWTGDSHDAAPTVCLKTFDGVTTAINEDITFKAVFATGSGDGTAELVTSEITAAYCSGNGGCGSVTSYVNSPYTIESDDGDWYLNGSINNGYLSIKTDASNQAQGRCYMISPDYGATVSEIVINATHSSNDTRTILVCSSATNDPETNKIGSVVVPKNNGDKGLTIDELSSSVDQFYLYVSGGAVQIYSITVTYGSAEDYVTQCCSTLGAIDGTADATGTETTLTVKNWTAVSNVTNYTVKLYKKNAGEWELANNNSTTGGASGAQATRTAVTDRSTGVTWSGLTYGDTYKVTVQAIGNGTSYCDGEETAIDEINSNALTSNEIPWKYSIYIDEHDNSTYAHQWINSLTSNSGYVDLTLDAFTNWYNFKLALAGCIWYGNNGTMNSTYHDNWTFSTGESSNCKLSTSMGGSYRFTVNTGTPTVSVTFPNSDQASGYKIYWDNSILSWSTLKYRIGNNSNNQNKTPTLVYGTDNFYVVETPTYNGMEAWHFANNTGWADSHTVYRTATNNEQSSIAITASTTFQQYKVTEDITVIPTTTHKTGTDNTGDKVNNQCEFYTINTPTSGMLTHTATITTPSHGEISLAYTDVSNTAQEKTSTTAGLAHRTKITATATPATGYQLSTFTVTPSGESAQNITSGQANNHILAKDATFEAEFRAKTYTITLDNEGADVGHEGSANVVLTYNSNSHAAITNPQKTGYTFAGWYSGDDGAGELVINTSGVLQNSVTVSEAAWTDASGNWIKDGTVTLHAKWTINQHTLTWNWGTDASCSGVAGTDYTAGGSVNYGATITYPDEALLSKTGYHFTGWSSLPSGNPSTMPDQALTITANWAINTYTVTWYVNGETYTTGDPTTSFNHGTTVAAGDMPSNPSAPNNCSDKVFMGWSTTNVGSGDGHADPGNIFTTTAGTRPTITANTPIYAVFADQHDGGTHIEWVKQGSTVDYTTGTYILTSYRGYAFTGSISGGDASITATAFSYTNDVATAAPSGAQELTITRLAANHYTISRTRYDETLETNVTEYLYAKAASAHKLAWYTSDDDEYSGNYYWHNSESGGPLRYSHTYVVSNQNRWAYIRTNESLNADVDLRSYMDQSGRPVYLVKKTEVDGGYTYDNYVTQCSAPTQVATPAITPTSSPETGSVTVSITCATDGAAIYYTTDGTDPSSSSTLYEGSFTVSCSGTVKAIGIKSPLTNSTIASQAYTITAPRPSFSPNGGDFKVAQSVSISDALAGTTVYYEYTTDGSEPSDPTSSSTAYSSTIPVAVGQTVRIKAIAISGCATSSAIVSKTFRVGWDFELVTTEDDLNAGDKIVILNGTTNALSTYNEAGNNRSSSSDFDISGTTVTAYLPSTSSATTVQVITLDGGPGDWKLKTTDTKWFNCPSAGKLTTVTTDGSTAEEKAARKWSIDIGSSPNYYATITNNNVTDATIQFNGNSTFAAYNTDQYPVKIYSIPNPDPLLKVEGTLSAFAGCTSAASAAQSFYVSGKNLSASIRVTAPTGYEVSLSSGSGYAAYIDVARVGTAVAKTQVYVRLKAGDAGSVAANNVVVSVEANSLSQNVAIPVSAIYAADTYVDRMHGNSTTYECGSYSAPDLSDDPGSTGTDCQKTYLTFQGWVAASDVNLDGTLKAGATVISNGTAKTADGTTYYSVWGEED